MSAEDDLATIQAVTDKIAGPMKVWVLHIWGEGIDNIVSLHYTFDGVLTKAHEDMTTQFKPPRPQVYVNAAMTKLSTDRYAQLEMVYYLAQHMEVSP